MEREQDDCRELVSARGLEALGILKRGTAYRMAAAKLIPCYAVGVRRAGIRFSPDEVRAALRRQSKKEEAR